MRTAESMHQKPQINKTSVLWGKEELFPLWESLSVPVACELFIFCGTLWDFLLSLVHFLQLLGLLLFFPWSLEKCLCKCSALNK